MRSRYSLTGLALAAVLALAAGSMMREPGTRAQSLTPEAALERLFSAERVQAEWFASAFLAQVPVAQIQQIVDQLRAGLGRFTAARRTADAFEVVFERGTLPVPVLTLDEQGRFTALVIGNPKPADPVAARREALEKIAALPGTVSVLVVEDGQETTAINADQPLAVGSAFKLAVLAALREQVNAGTHAWDEVVRLRPEWKSLPSGVLQNWPNGAPLTLDTLAAEMISISDNTATDALIDIAGKDQIEALAARNRPLLTTRELFVLKGEENAALLERWRNGDEAQRRALLREVDMLPLPPVAKLVEVTPGAEWYFSARELCALMALVQDLPLMSINPGVATTSAWQRVAFKGGSDGGVLNLTQWLVGKDGTVHCVAITWNNDAPVKDDDLIPLAAQLIGALE